MTIRKQPGDFRVREMLTAPPGATGSFAVIELNKESLTTPEAVARLAKALGVRHAEISHAGLKDKHAHTTQHVSVPATPAIPQEAGGERWSARLLGVRETALSAGDIAHNEFEIIVRDLTRADCKEMDARARRLADTGGLLVANYFGDQRFGSARHGEGFVAKHLVRGEFEQALKLAIGTPHRKDTGSKRTFTRMLASRWGRWEAMAAELPRCPERKAIELLGERSERSAGRVNAGDYRDSFASLPFALQEMCVDAYQSLLWNNMIRSVLAGIGTDALRTADPFGEMVFPSPEPARTYRDATVALPSASATYAEPWKTSLARVLQSEGLELAGLRVPGLRRPSFGKGERHVFVTAGAFAMSAPEADDLAGPRGKGAPERLKRTVSFSLPSGSYATVVLRGLGQ